MRLPQLDQKIELYWGEAALLASSIAEVVYTRALPQPLTSALALGALARVYQRVAAHAAKEQIQVGLPSRRPWRLTLRYDEVAALMYILPTAPGAGRVWGEVQRVSLNLDHVIAFELGEPTAG
jgi:hypothetical protein